MRLLLDTHAFLWWLSEDETLTASANEAIANPETLVHVSAATIWEIAIKANLGRLDVGGSDMAAEIIANGFIELPMTARHAHIAGWLPRHHDDPFDRMLIAQAQAEALTLVSRDAAFQSYDVFLLGA
ncbi:type II toxin-antitoxin system VapC family toxin [Candidatus Entotheonella palauensis]|uniref:DNA-binding protein n=1 Tax=Candidatus Entotheonella gemina TaxID=1429439 RepID=W4MC58_9BACT|nr:type II toxin-antitoxin system VapC family toxin [Candidatus Entotheonella palauensis]ETX07773.1 MAG: DNA-binding protein [Candidatus Entotheonella gemina]